jgi:hypothetical protein
MQKGCKVWSGIWRIFASFLLSRVLSLDVGCCGVISFFLSVSVTEVF